MPDRKPTVAASNADAIVYFCKQGEAGWVGEVCVWAVQDGEARRDAGQLRERGN